MRLQQLALFVDVVFNGMSTCLESDAHTIEDNSFLIGKPTRLREGEVQVLQDAVNYEELGETEP